MALAYIVARDNGCHSGRARWGSSAGTRHAFLGGMTQREMFKAMYSDMRAMMASGCEVHTDDICAHWRRCGIGSDLIQAVMYAYVNAWRR